MQKYSKMTLRKYFGTNSISISGLDKARKLLEKLANTANGYVVENYEYLNQAFSLRLTKTSTGIRADLQLPRTELLPEFSQKVYIKSKDNMDAAVCYQYHKIRQKAAARANVASVIERMNKDVEKLQNSKKFLYDVERHEKSSGITSEYGKMSYEDALYWLAWLNRWKNNNAELAEKFLK